MRKVSIFIPFFLAISACSSGEAEGDASVAEATGGGAGVAEAYRTSFDRAWQSAGEGSSPTQACASVFGNAVGRLQTTATGGQERDDALTALDACYVRAMARFVDTKLSVENPGTPECISLIGTLSVHRSALGGFLDDVSEDRAAYDRRLNELIGDKVRSACPDSASVILGE